MTVVTRSPGRARDADIDRRVLAVAAQQLAVLGFEGMSIAAVASAAATSRQAVYRRWPTKTDLANAVVADIGGLVAAPSTADPFADLVAELTEFQRGVSGPGRLSLVGTMLQDTTDPAVRRRYQQTVIAPRRARLRTILERGVGLGLLAQTADLDTALTMCTGSWYGRALAGLPVPRQWPLRSATLVWRAMGGTPPG